MDIELIIQNGQTVYYPVVTDGIRLTWERRRTPGRLEFAVLKDSVISFTEGDPVRLSVDGTHVFYGYVFKKSRNRDGAIDVVAYDQLRYLKNRDTLVDEGLKASDLVRRLARDFRLETGEIEDTGYVLETVVEEDSTLFDMIQGALEETLKATGRMFVLYDDAGRLTLRDARSMKLGLLIDAETAEDISYESGINGETRDRIKLVYNDGSTGIRRVFTSEDGQHVAEWGVLQYFEEIQSETGAQARADALLALYNRKTRRLTVKNAFGDIRVRAGCSLMVSLDLGDIIVNQFMTVEKVTHTFGEQTHTMELDMTGGEFIA